MQVVLEACSQGVTLARTVTAAKGASQVECVVWQHLAAINSRSGRPARLALHSPVAAINHSKSIRDERPHAGHLSFPLPTKLIKSPDKLVKAPHR
jgi:hypothetical protein